MKTSIFRAALPSYFVSVNSHEVKPSWLTVCGSSVCGWSLKMVLAVQRSCVVLISDVGFLGIGIERMTHFIKGTGRGCCVVSIISKELSLFLSH